MSNTIEILEAKVQELSIKERHLEYKRDMALLKKVYETLGGLLTDEITMKTTPDNVYFYMMDDDRTRLTEVFSLRLDRDWKTEQIKEVKTSAYSTSDNRDFELIRLVNLGQVAQFLLHGGKDIIKQIYNNILNDHKVELSNTMQQRWDAEKEIKAIIASEKQNAKVDLYKKLENEGLKFNYSGVENRRSIPELQIRVNELVKEVTYIKILNYTGKSVTIQTIVNTPIWNGDKGEYDYIPQHHTFTKVKLSILDYFLKGTEKFQVK